MGSLMAGWSTSPPCEKKVMKRSTSSLTRDEVKRFWKAKLFHKKEHLKEAHKDASHVRSRSISSVPSIEETPEGTEVYSSDVELEDESRSGSQPQSPKSKPADEWKDPNCWWRRSSYAYLNEPPHREKGRGDSYVSQFHVVDVREVSEKHVSGKSLPHTKSSLTLY